MSITLKAPLDTALKERATRVASFIFYRLQVFIYSLNALPTLLPRMFARGLLLGKTSGSVEIPKPRGNGR